MAGFVYFVKTPNLGAKPSAEAMANLAYVFADSPGMSCTACGDGPEGMTGTFLTLPTHGRKPEHNLDTMTWMRIPDKLLSDPANQAWVGMHNDDKPGPKSLERTGNMLGGIPVLLSDGIDWLVPIARWFESGDCALPHRFGVDVAGDFVTQPLDRYAHLWEMSESVFNTVMRDMNARHAAVLEEGNEQDVAAAAELHEKHTAMIGPFLETDRDKWEIAVSALAANYRIGPVEVSMLALLDSTTVEDVVLALIEWGKVVEVQKKTEVLPETSEPLGAAAD